MFVFDYIERKEKKNVHPLSRCDTAKRDWKIQDEIEMK